MKNTLVSNFLFSAAKCFALLLCTTASSNLFAQSNLALIKTVTGCAAYTDAAVLKAQSQITGSVSSWEWSGDCVDGFAYGEGVLRKTLKYGINENASENTYAYKGRMNRGKIYGFSTFQFETKNNNPAIPSKMYEPVWSFLFADRTVIIGGLGLEGSDALLSNAADAMPTQTISWQREIPSIGDSNLGNLSFQKIPCAIDVTKFPDCGFGDGKLNYDVYRFNKTPISTDGGFDFKNTERIYCPSPKDRNSCQPLVAGFTAPYIASIESFIREYKPKLTDVDAAVRNASADLIKGRELVAARKLEESNKVAGDLAVANSAFFAKLETAAVGELFGMADEFISKNDTAKARTVLRKLMGRFPDHKLAELSAKMLTDMQGK
jgi:hypothetical protein